jgi:hypothetical protein
MRSLPVAWGAALVLCSAAAAPSRAQAFPGDSAVAPAFPTALTLSALAGFGGLRATQTYIDSSDIDCDSVPCVSKHDIGGSLGLAARVQASLGPRMGLRMSVSYGAPRRKVSRTEPTQQSRFADRVGVIRAEALLLFRLKPQVPVFFGAGLAMASFTPGPVFGQDGTLEFGAALAVGFDRRITPRVGTRAEWTVYVMRPSTDLFDAEYEAPAITVDHHLSFGFNFLLNR